MTIGKKIALGFGALIVIMALLGGIALFNMKSVQTLAGTLATEYVPESEIANDLDLSIASAQLAIRSYAYTTDDAYLEATHKALAEMHKHQLAAQKLADEHSDLVRLREHLKEINPALKVWEELIAQTEVKTKAVVAARVQLNQSASDFITNIDRLITGQEGKLDTEIKAGAAAQKLQERARKLELANDIRGDGNAARIAMFKSEALHDPKLIEDGLKGFEVMEKRFAELLGLLTVQEDIAELSRVKADAHTYRDAMKGIMGDHVDLAESGRKRIELAVQVRALADETATTGTKRALEAANASSQKLSAASAIVVWGLIAALLVGVLLAWLIIRNTKVALTGIANTLAAGAEQVAAASSQVSSASQGLASGASQQAASLEETGASLEEISAMTRRNSEGAQKACELAKLARSAGDKGVVDMQGMSSAMDAIKSSSNDIAKIIKTIDEIAFQTNILALNAAVEAARAGEAGMGFAVVADEVRNLAQRSAQAAKETAAMIEGAIAKTAHGVCLSTAVSGSLTEIVSKVRQVDELVSEVASASQEQSKGIVEINNAVSQMDKTTQSNAAGAEEGAAAAEELNAQAASMEQTVAELLSLVGGNKSGPRRPVTHAAEAKHYSAPVRNGRRPVAITKDNGHSSAVPTRALASHSRSEIPMDGEFKSF